MYVLTDHDVIADNLYVGGGDVTLSGTVDGDVTAAGGTVVIAGPVRDDLAAAAGNLTVLGSVGGDARLAGGNVLIGGTVGGDLLAAGGTVKVLGGVTVGKDLVIAGGMVTYAGSTTGNATFTGGEVVIDGHVTGNVLATVDKKVTLGDHAVIDGALVYRAPQEDVFVTSDQARVRGGVQFEQREARSAGVGGVERGLAAALGALLFVKLVALALAAAVLVLVFTRFSGAVVRTVTESFWLAVARGFVVLVVVPIVAGILLATLVGGFLGFLLLTLYGLALLIAAIYSNIVAGALLMGYFKKEQEYALVWWHALVGVVLLAVLALIPIIGWAVCLVFFLGALGSLARLVRDHVWAMR